MEKLTDVSSDHQPHLVMVVNNSLYGDSRVQKSAVAAAEAGFRVTVLGLRVKTHESTGTVGPARIFRAEFDPVHIRAWNQKQGRVPLWEFNGENESVTSVDRKDIAPVFTLDARHPIEVEDVRSLKEQQFGTFLGSKAIGSLTARLGLWDRLWPMTLDYINAFFPSLVDLKPDLIHCHDYHPMPAVVSYVLYMARQGKKVPWVYDAHEWLPGQKLPGPTANKTAWLAVENKLIRAADAVVSVSDVLASKMKQRHKLASLPMVVTNAPSRELFPPTGARTDLRTDIGLPDAASLIVYVGKLSELRGIYTAAQALEHLPNVHLAFVGSKSPVEIARLESIASKFGAQDRLHILEYVPAQSVTAYVSTADLGISPLLPTEAHHSALPTKIREYLHSGLPLVVSNMREQAKFVQETGVGEVHEAGDSRDFARAVKLVLSSHNQYRSKLTEELLAEHSWEKQADRLEEVWRGLSAKVSGEVTTTSQLSPATTSYRVCHGDVKQNTSLAYFGGTPQLDAIAEEWLSTGGDVLTMDDRAQCRIESAVDLFEAIKKHNIDLLMYQGGESIFSGIRNKDLNQERRELYHLGLDMAVYVGSHFIVPSRRITKADPTHPLAKASSKIRGNIDRRVRLYTESFSDLPVPVFTHSYLAAALVPQATWLPPVVSVDGESSEIGPEGPKVGVLPTIRSADEHALIAQTVKELRGRGVDVTEIRGRGLIPESTRQYDILIHSLHRIDMSEAAAHHMASGGVLVGAPPYVYDDVPFWEVHKENVFERVLELVNDQEQWKHNSLRTLEYSRQTFTADHAVCNIINTMRPQL